MYGLLVTWLWACVYAIPTIGTDYIVNSIIITVAARITFINCIALVLCVFYRRRWMFLTVRTLFLVSVASMLALILTAKSY